MCCTGLILFFNTYDEMGRPVRYCGYAMTWTRGKLASYKNSKYDYDCIGRRIGKAVSGEVVTYTYDSQGRLIKSSDGMEYFYGGTEVIAFKYNGLLYLYKKDIQGNINAILDSAGNTVVQYEYDAWGNHTVSGSNTALGNLNPFRYRGYFYDTDTGFYYLETRYYDPEIGRFISPDSVDYADPQTVDGLNLYAYCGNNPVMAVDPTGTMSDLLFTAIGGLLTQFVVSVYGYLGFAAASIFDKEIRQDMHDIGWNPFNTDEGVVVKSKKVSFFKGVPVIRHSGLDGSSMTLGAIFLYRYPLNYPYEEEYAKNVVKHERGHSTQLMCMGLGNYALLIGIPSPWKNEDFTPWELSASINGGSNLGAGASKQQLNAAKTYFALACIPIINICNIFWFLLYR